jgi:hypothetical protein
MPGKNLSEVPIMMGEMAHGDMDHTPNPTLPILLKHTPDILRFGEIAFVGFDLCAVPVFLRGVFWQIVFGDLSETREGGWERVVVVVYRDYFVFSGFLQGEYNM